MESRGQYELLRSLGRGGMAEVFLARFLGPHGFSRQVVIKRVLPHFSNDPVFTRRMIEEARIAARLHHEHIVQILELGDDHGTPFLALEHIAGKDLHAVATRLKKRGERVPPRFAVIIVRGLLSALAHAHAAVRDDGRPLGLVHRDVSSSNVLVSWQGAVKLIDFGIARIEGSEGLTTPGAVIGKAMYMSPEQMRGDRLDGRSDVYAVGVLLHLLLTNEPPKVVGQSQAPPAFRAVLAGALAEEASARFTAEAMLRALTHEAATPAELGEWLRALFADELLLRGEGNEGEGDEVTRTRAPVATRPEDAALASIESQLSHLDTRSGGEQFTAEASAAQIPAATEGAALTSVHEDTTRLWSTAAPTASVDEAVTSSLPALGVPDATRTGSWHAAPATRAPRARPLRALVAVALVVLVAIALVVAARSTPPDTRAGLEHADDDDALREVALREVAPPAVALPAATPPAVALPEVALPDEAVLSEAALAEVVLPEATLPEDAGRPEGVARKGPRRVKTEPTTEVDFNTTPPGARVIVDGVMLGRTPLRASLTPGAHALVLVDADVRKELPLVIRRGAKPIVLQQRMR